MTSVEILILALLTLGLVVLLWLLWAWLRVQRNKADTPRDAYTQALSALINGDQSGALRHLKEAVQADSENLDAYIRLGDLLRENGEVRKALAVHRDLTVRPRLSESDRARILESLTQDFLSAGRYEEAGQSADRLLHLNRQNRFAYRALQEVAEALKDWPRAVKVVGERMKIEGQDGKVLLARYHGYVGSEELRAGNTESAKKHFAEALKLDPDCLLAALCLGDLEQSAGNVEKAIEHWRTVALKAPERGGLVFDRLERAYFELGRFEDVVSFYRELLHGSPREASAPALLALAEIYRRKGSLDEAESFVHEAMEVEPDHLRGHRHLVKLALDRKDPQAALSRLDRLLSVMDADGLRGNCRHCHQELEEPVWRCPHCRGLNPTGL